MSLVIRLDLVGGSPAAADVEGALEHGDGLGLRFFTLRSAGDSSKVEGNRIPEVVRAGIDLVLAEVGAD